MKPANTANSSLLKSRRLSGSPFNNASLHLFKEFNSNSASVSYKKTSSESYVRPVINLNSNVLYRSGTGTSDDPYVIGY